MKSIPRLFTLLFALLVLSPSLHAQSMHGRILVQGDTVGIDGAELIVQDSLGSVVVRGFSDEAGNFRIAVPDAGLYEIYATRLGYTPTMSPLLLNEAEMVELELWMAEEAIPLEPINVKARRRIRPGTLDVFYDRMPRMKQRGQGHFLTLADIENSGSATVENLMYLVPGVFLRPGGIYSGQSLKMRAKGGFCTPRFFVDGLPQEFGRMPELQDLEGVEIYRKRWESPDTEWPDPCGMIFMWRKADWGSPFQWKKAFLAGGFLSVVLLLVV